jgi:peroxiredoxin
MQRVYVAMLSEGTEAPAVDLAGWVNGERARVDLADYLGEGIVVLAFYPADFNPACTMQESDLGDLDLFTMQKDVSVFGVSPDSTYSHEAFADRYSLKIPLLSDPDGEAAAAYDVALASEVGEPLCQRAVFVVDHRGVVQYAWATEDLAEQVTVDPVKRAVGSIGGDETAVERYRVGYDHYAEGREAFTAAMADYEDREWLGACGGFEEAESAFTAAADHFDTAVRFAETADFETVVDRAEEKADTLQHAANWLGDSADALGSGRGKQGKEYRQDAERLLATASDLPEPPEGDAFTLTDAGVDLDESIVADPEAEDQAYAWRADGADGVDTELGIDDEALDAAQAGTYDGDVEGDAVEGELDMDIAAIEDADEEATDGRETDVSGDDHGPADSVTASPDTTTRPQHGRPGDRRNVTASDRADEERTPARTTDATAGEGGEADASGDDPGEEVAVNAGVEELDLADPTDGEDQAEDDDERADWDIPGQ